MEKNKQTNKPIYLYRIYDYDGSNDLLLAEWDEPVVFKGDTYGASPLTHDTIGDNKQGEVDALRVSLSNVSRLIQSYLEQYDFRGLKVDVTLTWEDNLDEYYTHTFYIDSYSANTETAEFMLYPKTDVLSAKLPGRTYSRTYCQWQFKSDECGYTGEETECNKTRQRCQALDNYKRYGGFPAIPLRRIFLHN